MPLFPLILVVILAGLLLGGVLAHFFGGSRVAPGPGPTTVAAVSPPPIIASTPSAESSPSATPSPVASPSPSPATTSTQLPTTSPSQSITATTHAASTKTPAHKATPIPTPAASPLPARKPVALAATTPPTASAAPAPARTLAPSGNSRATTIVRSYLEALQHGERATAASYLSRGTPSETFMNAESRIESISS
ncbi:MAG TPA: hypothetical protein VN909_01540, partial [Candidatus Dormibacteraeota bacterium]|nr:hypothetical protein [Candidatus Dormibacteraeota bacterium]